MLHLLVDTCVWLDLAKDYREQPVISALEDLIAARQIKLVVPQVVLDEFARNKGRVIEDARRSLQSHFRLVREAVSRFGDDEYRDSTLGALNEVDHKIVTGSESVLNSIDKIEKLLAAQPALPTTDAIKRAVTDRALAGLAPYHRAKNSVGDAVLIEVYTDMVKGARKSKTKRFAFVTHNSKDFSEPNGDRRKAHPDLAELFVSPTSTYWGSLVDLIKDVELRAAGRPRQRIQFLTTVPSPVRDPGGRAPAVPAGLVQPAYEPAHRNREGQAEGRVEE